MSAGAHQAVAEGSLKRLRVDAIDLFYHTVFDPDCNRRRAEGESLIQKARSSTSAFRSRSEDDSRLTPSAGHCTSERVLTVERAPSGSPADRGNRDRIRPFARWGSFLTEQSIETRNLTARFPQDPASVHPEAMKAIEPLSIYSQYANGRSDTCPDRARMVLARVVDVPIPGRPPSWRGLKEHRSAAVNSRRMISADIESAASNSGAKGLRIPRHYCDDGRDGRS